MFVRLSAIILMLTLISSSIACTQKQEEANNDIKTLDSTEKTPDTEASIPVARDVKERKEAEIQVLSGERFFISNVQFRGYFGLSGAWVPNAKYMIFNADGKLRAIQDWLWSDLDFAQIDRIQRLEKIDEFESLIFKNYLGYSFELKKYTPAFKISLTNGREMVANVLGKLKGATKVGSVPAEAVFTMDEIKSVMINKSNFGSPVATVLDTAGNTFTDITNLNTWASYDYNINDFDQMSDLYLVSILDGIEYSETNGGFVLKLSAGELNKIQLLEKVDREKNVFRAFGLFEKPLKVKLASINLEKSDSHLPLDYFTCNIDFEGISGKLFIDATRLQEVRFNKDFGFNNYLASVKVYDDSNAVAQFDNVSNMEFWYDNGSAFSTSELISTLEIVKGNFTLNVKIADIQELQVVKIDSLSSYTFSLNTRIVLRNGEKIEGNLAWNNGKPNAVVGKRELGNYSYDACIPLINISSFKYIE